jgi:hypothetical protein
LVCISLFFSYFFLPRLFLYIYICSLSPLVCISISWYLSFICSPPHIYWFFGLYLGYMVITIYSLPYKAWDPPYTPGILYIVLWYNPPLYYLTFTFTLDLATPCLYLVPHIYLISQSLYLYLYLYFISIITYTVLPIGPHPCLILCTSL